METEQETLSVEETRYRDLCCKLSLVDSRIEEKTLALQGYVFRNPRASFLNGATVVHSDGKRDELEAALQQLYAERQVLLPEIANLKFNLGLGK